MIGGGSDGKNEPGDQPSPSPPVQPTGGLGRRLLGTIRALLPAPTPPAAATKPKVGLGILLHLRPDRPLLRPTPPASSSPSASQEEEKDAAAAAAAAGRADDGACKDADAAPAGPLTRHMLSDPAAAAPSTMFRQFSDLPMPPPAEGTAGDDARFCANGDEPGASKPENVVRQQGGAGDRKGKDLRGADQDQEDAFQPRDEETTSCHIAPAAQDQEDKVGSVDAVECQDVVVAEQGVIGRKSVTTDAIAVPVQDQDKGVVTVTATANVCDRDTGKKEKVRLQLPYPQRPGRLSCPSYMSKGTCSYGLSCQHHHPPLKAKPDDSWRPSEQGNHGVTASLELNCIFVPIRELKAKTVDSWRPSEQGNHGFAAMLELNRVGLPLREGARNCSYYMRSGACRYGKHCHFNHPEDVIDAQFNAPTGWEDSALQLEKSSEHHTTVDDTSHLKKSSGDATLDDDTSYSKKSFDHATLDDTSYSKKSSDHATLDDTSSTTGVLPPNIFRMLLPPQKVADSTAAMVIPVKKDSNWSSTSDHSDGCCSADSSDGPLCKQEHVDSSDRPFRKQAHVDYPERPGRPDCLFYMKFGDCKFVSACNYHHPKDRYPERVGETECPFYMKHRFCKFGAQCRYNHPKDSNPTAQSPGIAKRFVAANEQHRPTRITLEHHMPQQQQYPERPGQPECRYYMQFGKCKFLSACIFHHPRRDGLPSGPAHSDQVGPETHGMPECPFYIKNGRCHFGSACEFRHPNDTTEGASGHRAGSSYDNSTRPENAAQQGEQALYPERPGEPECVHYMRHGSCRFQMNCKFHHPAVRLSRKQYDSTYH